MKSWIGKLINQFELDWQQSEGNSSPGTHLNEERATLLYLIDTYNKHLFETNEHPIRKTREQLDEFAKKILNAKPEEIEKVLFRFRQFFTSYRLDEYTYVQKSVDDFKNIVWDFVEQLSDEFQHEQNAQLEVRTQIEKLKEAVESESIETLKNQSREFIDFYIEHQTQQDIQKNKRLSAVNESLDQVKKKLVKANESLTKDHLTKAYNRKSFDDHIQKHHKLAQISGAATTLVFMDIDFFKKVNDTYGHAIGDFVLIECVKLLKENFNDDSDFVARIGGEEFAILLPETNLMQASVRIDRLLNHIRSETLVSEDMKINFTMSAGIAQLLPGESIEDWMKRSDFALYHSKNNGRDQYTLAGKEVDENVA